MRRKILLLIIILIIILSSGCVNNKDNRIEKSINHPPITKIQIDNNTIGDIGDPFIIKWNATDQDNDTLKIDIYYLDRDMNGKWEIIIKGMNNTGYYEWDTYWIMDSSYIIKVVAFDDEYESVDTIYIKIFIKTRYGISFDFPNEGEIISGNYNLTWVIQKSCTRNSNIDYENTLRLSYSNDNFTNENILYETHEIYMGRFYYNWDTTKVPNGHFYQIKIEFYGNDTLGQFTESNYFTIYND